MGKSGHNTKDSTISHNFNEKKVGGLTPKELKALEHKARVEKLRLDQELKKQNREVKKMDNTDNTDKTPTPENHPPSPEPAAEPIPVPLSPEIEDKLSNQMLNDLRYAYRNAVSGDGNKGRKRLMKLMESDQEFKFAMKELIKVEVGLMTSKLRAKETGDGKANQMVFVVLKGLKEDEGILSQMEPDDSAIDVRQITNAVNPDGTVYSPDDVDKW